MKVDEEIMEILEAFDLTPEQRAGSRGSSFGPRPQDHRPPCCRARLWQ